MHNQERVTWSSGNSIIMNKQVTSKCLIRDWPRVWLGFTKTQSKSVLLIRHQCKKCRIHC